MNEGLLVKEVAQRLEFPDSFQFSRAFKRVYDIPPGKLIAARNWAGERETSEPIHAHSNASVEP
jgi:AraC-like DNA-binding protein